MRGLRAKCFPCLEKLFLQVEDAAPGAQAHPQLVRMEGLGEVIVRSGIHAFHQILGSRPRGQQQDVEVRFARDGAHAAADLNAIEAGHHPIEDRQPRSIRTFDDLPCLNSIVGHHRLVAPVAQHAADDGLEHGIILGHQDSKRRADGGGVSRGGNGIGLKVSGSHWLRGGCVQAVPRVPYRQMHGFREHAPYPQGWLGLLAWKCMDSKANRKLRVAVLDDWQGVARTSADWSALEARAEVVFFTRPFENEDDAAGKLADFEIVLSMRERTPLAGSLIARLPRLALLGITGAQNRSLDLEACTKHGVLVSNTVAAGPDRAATAELALGLLIAAARAIPAADAGMRAGRFQEGLPVGMCLAGKTMGIVGLGKLGSAMARYCRALDMHVLAWSQNLTEERARAAGTEPVSKEDLLGRSDAVSIHLVLSPRTRGLFGREDLARMKPGAILVNTSRGPIVDETALVEAV